MLHKIFVVLLYYIGFIGCMYVKDLVRTRRDKATAAVLFVCSLYFAVSFVLGENWPNIDDLAKAVLLQPMIKLIAVLEPGQT